MNNKKLLSVIGQIEDQFILAAEPDTEKPKTHHLLRWSMVAAACLCLALVGFSMWMGKGVNPSVPPSSDLPEYNAIGGEGNFDYERAYAPKLYQLDSALMDYIVEVGGTDLYEWIEKRSNEIKKSKFNISDPVFEPVLIQVIERYGVPKEVFERINDNNIAIYEKNGDYNLIEQVCYAQEEVDALYSDNAAKITEVFATKYAIVVGDKAYAPNFYLNASEKELKKYDIPVSAIKEKAELLLADGVITKASEE